MGKCRKRGFPADLGIFTHILEYSGILGHIQL